VSRVLKVQPKGDSSVSLYGVKEFEQFFGGIYLETLAFSTDECRAEVQKNIPWLLRWTVFGYEPRRLGAHLRQKLLSGFVADVSVRWIDDTKGYGLFAEADFPVDTYIGEYVGLVRKIQRFHADVNSYCMHYPTAFFSYNYFVLDAKDEGNETRFINHSNSPNLKPLCVLDRNLLHVVFYTTQRIVKGEELTFFYGKGFTHFA
jgi:uncharacterized protein